MLDRESRVLEFGHVLERLAAQARSAPGKALCQALKPHTNYAQVADAQEETAQAEAIYYKLGYHPVPEFQDILPLLARAQVGSILSAGDLLTVGDALACARQVKALLRREEEDETPNGVRDMGAALYENRDLEEDIRRCILSPEEISDFASPELAKIRRQIRSGGERVTQKLNSYLHNPQLQKYLQEPIITIRADRYVLPVRQEYRSQVPGLIHDQSSSGATLFIEPMAVVEINNEIRQLRGQERGEIERILGEFSARTAGSSEALRQNQQILTELDFIFAKAALSREMRGVAPRLNQKGILNIKKGRHPMIDREKVVPLDIHLGREFTTLIITGPNTGGKTVALKTCGLFALMTQAGLHIPAELGSEMPVFEAIYADIGDEQSIAQSLSTFSSHMTHIVEILESAGKDCLVLLDELGAGTDPTEGAALAISILNTLHERGVTSVSTTHYSELKEYALVTRGVVNASVEFDVATLRPTFKLLIGVPGKSNAFEIARRLGLSEDIIEASKKLIENEAIRFEETLIKIEEKRKKTEAEHEEILRLRRQIEDMKAEMADEREKARAASAELIERAQEEASAIVRDTRQETEEIYKEIRYIQETTAKSVKDNKKLEALRRKIKDQEKNIFDMYKIARPEEDEELDIDDIKMGMKVHVQSLHKEGEVVKIMPKDSSVMVQTDNMKLKVGLADLTKSKAIAKPKEKKVSYKSADRHTMDTKLDLRGKNGEESLYLVDKMISDAVVSGTHQLMIVHGKGTGKLRQVIHAYLKDNSLIKDFRLGAPNEGGSGVTVVEL